jgi:hypothetical protein
MPKSIVQGDYVRIVEREALPADVKSQLFFPHYIGLAGKVGKVYPDETLSVNVDLDCLPKEILQRHANGSDLMRQKWLDGISDEARNKLSAAEKKFALSYTILVAASDVVPATAPEPKKPAAPRAEAISAVLELEDTTEAASAETEELEEPKRKTLEELEAEEQRHLEEIQNRKTS